MAEVTVGVPVYNGADLIAESLECLVNQTFRDIEILIFDNASTDDTQQIVEDFAGRDSRIRYIRRPENVGAIQNFIDPLDQATSPYFLWRAHDDLSSVDYIEKLLAGLKRTPGAKLATGTIEHVRRAGSRTEVYVPKLPARSLPAIEIVQLMFRSHAGWYYGLWETATLRTLVHRVWTEFPYAWASDHLTLYPLLLDRAVAAVPETSFIQRVVVKEYTPKKGQRPSLELVKKLRAIFSKSCEDFLAERDFDVVTRLVLNAAIWPYTGKRVYKARRVAKRELSSYFKRLVIKAQG
jgi:glycosyltransferase involved in cell wall biosynthesis